MSYVKVSYHVKKSHMTKSKPMSDKSNNKSSSAANNDPGNMLFENVFNDLKKQQQQQLPEDRRQNVLNDLKQKQSPEVRRQILRSQQSDDTESSSTSESSSSSDDDDDSGTPTTDEVSMSSDNDEQLETEQNEGKTVKPGKKAPPTQTNKKPVISLKNSGSLQKSQPPSRSTAPANKKSTQASTSPTYATPSNAGTTNGSTQSTNNKHQTTAFRVPTPSNTTTTPPLINTSTTTTTTTPINNQEILRRQQDVAEREKNLVKSIQELASAKSLFNEEKKKHEESKLELEEMKKIMKKEYEVLLATKESITRYRDLQKISEAAIASSIETLKRKELEIEEQMKELTAMRDENAANATKPAKVTVVQDIDKEGDVMIVEKKSNKHATTTLKEVESKSKKSATPKKIESSVDVIQMDVQQQQPDDERRLLNLTKLQLQTLIPKQTFDMLDNLSNWGQQNVFQCFAYATKNGTELEVKNVSDGNSIVFSMFVKTGYH